MSYRRIVLMLCSAAIMSVPGFAKGKDKTGSQAGGHWQMMDTNNDGTITPDEWNSMFAKHDTNNDGILSRDEMLTAHGRHHGQMSQDRFRGMDTNNDGRISRDEWRGNNTAFSKVDKNGDGWVSSDEWNDPTAYHGSTDQTGAAKRGQGQTKSHGKGHDKH